MRVFIFLALISIGFGFAMPAEAQKFSLSKSNFQKCIGELKPEKRLLKTIADSCAVPAVERECRYGGKNSNSIYGDCPDEVVGQMGRWIKQESAAIRKRGGKPQKEAQDLLRFIGNGRQHCGEAKSGRKMDAMNVSFCQAIVLAQTYGMLHFINTRMK